jgi:hypothetical protein
MTTPSAVDCGGTLDPAGRHVLEADNGVGRDAPGTCADIGGTPLTVTSAGTLYTRSTWTDPQARLRTEIWDGNFQRLLASGAQKGDERCVAVSAVVTPASYVVVTCHARDSRVPIATPGDPSTYTFYHLTVLYP